MDARIMSIIIYGPAGCGKTRNAARFAKFFGMTEIVDDEMDPYPLTPMQVQEFKAGTTLYLTYISPHDKDYSYDRRRYISFDDAFKMMRG
jgi:hypothetical protein